jgi:hypothetical protein
MKKTNIVMFQQLFHPHDSVLTMVRTLKLVLKVVTVARAVVGAVMGRVMIKHLLVEVTTAASVKMKDKPVGLVGFGCYNSAMPSKSLATGDLR